ncbi:hypothetical protein L665_04079 [Ralstonia solanacearum SD54]|nr:hypothetical protein L665_04079 [Ralstonia solanacearum SD54]
MGSARQPSTTSFFYPDPAAIAPTSRPGRVGLAWLIYTQDARLHSSFGI